MAALGMDYPWVYTTTTDLIGFDKVHGEIEIEIDIKAEVVSEPISTRYLVDGINFHSISIFNELGDVTSSLEKTELELLGKLCAKLLPEIMKEAQKYLDQMKTKTTLELESMH